MHIGPQPAHEVPSNCPSGVPTKDVLPIWNPLTGCFKPQPLHIPRFTPRCARAVTRARARRVTLNLVGVRSASASVEHRVISCPGEMCSTAPFRHSKRFAMWVPCGAAGLEFLVVLPIHLFCFGLSSVFCFPQSIFPTTVVRSRIANAFVLVDSGHLLIHMGERTGYTRGSGCLIGVSDTRDCRLRGIDPVDPDLWCLTLQTHPHSARSSPPFRKNSIHLVSQLPFLQTTSTRRWVRCHGHPWPRPKRLGSNESHGQPVILGHTPLSSSPVTGQ